MFRVKLVTDLHIQKISNKFVLLGTSTEYGLLVKKRTNRET